MTETAGHTFFEHADAEALSAGSLKLYEGIEKYTAVTNAEEAEIAAEILAQAKGFRRDVDTARMALIRPSLDRTQAINAEAKVITSKLDEVIKHFDKISKVYLRAEKERLEREEAQRRLAYQNEMKARNDAAIAKLQQQLRETKAKLQRTKGDDVDQIIFLSERMNEIITGIKELGGEVPTDAESTPRDTTVRVTGSQGSKTTLKAHWTFEVEDLSQVPVAYLQLDEKLVRQFIRNQPKPIAEDAIPGLRIFDEGSLVSRS